MKTAISIPDAVFREADRLAREMGVSRSELYARAVREYLARNAPERVTEAMDRVAEAVDTRSDRFVRRAARRRLRDTSW